MHKRKPTIRSEYDKIVDFACGTFRTKSKMKPLPGELFDFMFHTESVPAHTAEKSESLISEIMQDGRTWAWTEIDYSAIEKVVSEIGTEKVIGAIGLDADGTSFDVLDLVSIHKIWKKYWRRNKNMLHPLIPIIEAWYGVQATTTT